MGTKVIVSRSCKEAKIIDRCDYPRLMVGETHGTQIFLMTSPTKGICLTNHHESYYGIQSLEGLKDFKGSLKIFNTH